jgi:histidine triad (HIT) family protein
MKDCAFCNPEKNGNTVLYRDRKCLVILDKRPISYGHVLVIPIEHYKDVFEAPEELVSHLFLTATRYGKRLKKRLGAKGANIVTNIGKSAGQTQMHLHIHIIPRYGGWPVYNKSASEISEKDKRDLLAKLEE